MGGRGATSADDARGETAAPPAPAHTAPGDPAADAAEGQRGTRNKVARSILDHGPSTTADLAERLELTPAAVRRHLDSLVAEGVVEPRERRVYGSRSRGRPAKAFALTDAGRDAFYQAYDQLAGDALRWIARAAGGAEAGEAAVAAFARARAADQLERHRERVEAADPADRVRILAEALTEDGYAATTRDAHPASPGEQLCQHHCPVAHTAEQFPQLCEAEAEVFSRLLGTHVQRLATIAHGDGVCTTFVPGRDHVPPASGAAPPARTARQPAPRPPHEPHAKRPAGPASAATSGRNPA